MWSWCDTYFRNVEMVVYDTHDLNTSVVFHPGDWAFWWTIFGSVCHPVGSRWCTLTRSSLCTTNTKHHRLSVRVLTTRSWITLPRSPLLGFTDKKAALVFYAGIIFNPVAATLSAYAPQSSVITKTRKRERRPLLPSLISPARSSKVCLISPPPPPPFLGYL